jgi:hypothetical protein
MSTHIDSGWRCTVGHFDKAGNIAPPCIQCSSCGEHIRPEDMGNECPGPMTAERREREFLATGILIEQHE